MSTFFEEWILNNDLKAVDFEDGSGWDYRYLILPSTGLNYTEKWRFAYLLHGAESFLRS